MIKHHPKVGTVLRCDYEPGFRPPEMVKRRPVIVISPRLRHRDGLCTVVPLSSDEPRRMMPYHCTLRFDPLLPAPYDNPVHWVKADMIATVAFHRLSGLFHSRDQTGNRHYDVRVLSSEQLREVQACVLHALGLAT